MSQSPGAIRSLWYRWKALRLPWRKKWIVGFDLAGNTFWEFKDAINTNRLRRIVKYSGKTHLGDVKVTPQWAQWLRHMRENPPSIQEQQLDEVRQVRIKELARRADERWAALPSARDAPSKQQPVIASVNDPAGYVQQTEPEEHEGVRNAVGSQQEVKDTTKGRDTDKGRFKGETRTREQSPWDTGQKRQGEPEAWIPKPAVRR